MTIEVAVGTSATIAAAERRVKLLKVWPLLQRMVRDFWPRDSGAEDAFLTMAREAFDAFGDHIGTVINKVVAETWSNMKKESTLWIKGHAAEPSWEAQRKVAKEDALWRRELSGGSRPTAEDPAAKTAKAAEAAAAAEALKAAKAAEDAKGGGESEGVGGVKGGRGRGKG